MSTNIANPSKAASPVPKPSYALFEPHVRADHFYIMLKGKQPVDIDWQRGNRLFSDADFLMNTLKYNLGIRLTKTDLIIDVDPRNFPVVNGKILNSLAALARHINYDFQLAPRVRTGGGGLHIYLKKPADLKIVGKHKEFPGIEFKTKGQQVVAAGSVHPDTKRHYYVEPDPFIDELWMAPEATQTLLDLIKKPERKAATIISGIHSPEQLEGMLRGLNPRDFRNHEEWLKLMMACHHATGGEGSDIFADWSTEDPMYHSHGAKIQRRWESLNSDGTGRITYKALYKILHMRKADHLIPPPFSTDEFTPVDSEETAQYL